MEQDRGSIVAEAVLQWLGRIEIGEGRSHGRMVVFPAFGNTGGAALDYRTLAEAIGEGRVEVVERPAATVPELVLRNRGKEMVLVLDGEEIVGGKQNRIVNASFLVAAESEVIIPVSCVEQGRWRDVSPRFSAGESTPFDLKREKFEQVRRNLRAGAGAVADQMAIWSSLEARRARADVKSETGAMDDIYRKHEESLDAYFRAFPFVANAAGLVVAIGGQVVGGDLFDQTRTAGLLWPKLIRSYALDALAGAGGAAVGRDQAQGLLERTRGASFEMYLSLALGHDVRFEGDGVVGAALVYQNTPVHVSLFRSDGSQANLSEEIASASRRRSFRQQPRPSGNAD